MAATGYTSGDPQKVDTSGDTMTGDLVLPDSSPAASEEYVTEALAAVGGLPADTVSASTSFGIEPAVGVGTRYARSDHQHGTPDAPGGGGGSVLRTSLARINDTSSTADISSTPWARAFAPVTNTPLLGQITAAVGDRILVCPNMMYQGAMFLDFVLEKNDGTPSVYAAAEPGTPSVPLGEGNPALYPGTSFDKRFDHMFTVTSANQINGSGKATVALYFQGTGKVFCHTLYPWSLRLQNIGPEPS